MHGDIYATKGIEYLLVIAYLLVLVATMKLLVPRLARAAFVAAFAKPRADDADRAHAFRQAVIDDSIDMRGRHDHDGQVDILVHDNGPGIPTALRGRVFEPFFTTKESGKGTGLGLAVSYGIVRDSGGTLALTDESPGATFRIDLPACD